MAAMNNEKEMAFAAARFLLSLEGDQSSKKKQDLMETRGKLEIFFGVDAMSVDSFLMNDLGSDLPEIMDAGVAATKAGFYEADLKEAREDEYFASYNSVISSRDYFVGCSEGSLEYLRRKSRVLAKFREHCPKTDLPIDNPMHPLRTAFIKTTGRWPWANEKPEIDTSAADAEADRLRKEEEERRRRERESADAEKQRLADEAEAKRLADEAAAAAKAAADAEAAAAAKVVKKVEKPPPQTPEEHVTQTSFMENLNAVDTNRDYVIIVDKSASMKLGGRWKSAEDAVKILSPAACKCDSDGITLYFFSSHSKTSKGDFPAFNRFDNIKTAEEVMALFSKKENTPKGGTDLTRVFRDALQPSEKPKSILVITDGSPDDQKSSEDLIIEVCNALPTPDHVLITMIQVGDDKKADEYLLTLDEKLTQVGAKYDIVDCLPFKKIQGIDFATLMGNAVFQK